MGRGGRQWGFDDGGKRVRVGGNWGVVKWVWMGAGLAVEW